MGGLATFSVVVQHSKDLWMPDHPATHPEPSEWRLTLLKPFYSGALAPCTLNSVPEVALVLLGVVGWVLEAGSLADQDPVGALETALSGALWARDPGPALASALEERPTLQSVFPKSGKPAALMST